jgi:hypothetical protein
LRCTSVQVVELLSRKVSFRMHIGEPSSMIVTRETISGHATWNDFSFVPIGKLLNAVYMNGADNQLDHSHSAV